MGPKKKGSGEWKDRPVTLDIWDFPSMNGVHPVQKAARRA